jgi:hypothetical protein
LGDLGGRKTMLSGAYLVFRYFLLKISKNRVIEMETKLQEAYNSIPYQCVKDVILHNSGLEEEEINKKS